MIIVKQHKNLEIMDFKDIHVSFGDQYPRSSSFQMLTEILLQ